MEVGELADKYIGELSVSMAEFVPAYDDLSYDAAYVSLSIPNTMLQEYAQIKGINEDSIIGEDFWKETKLVEKLGKLEKNQIRSRDGLDDMLEFLGGDVEAKFTKFSLPGFAGSTRLSVTEVPDEEEFDKV